MEWISIIMSMMEGRFDLIFGLERTLIKYDFYNKFIIESSLIYGLKSNRTLLTKSERIILVLCYEGFYMVFTISVLIFNR